MAAVFLNQAPGLHFNRGALLNAGALLLAGSEYDCFVFHDVDTVCGVHETVRRMHLVCEAQPTADLASRAA